MYSCVHTRPMSEFRSIVYVKINHKFSYRSCTSGLFTYVFVRTLKFKHIII
ncbi:hypothetical protein HanIR_Chr09g0408151 [Helianthus annuus]|nr:hypothetical protein HanIR_Chr09g0408151 [Helianthus annuus]